MTQNQSNTLKKHEIVDSIILNDLTLHPDKPINQIGRELNEIGAYEHRQSVYDRLKASDYLRVELTKLRERISENTARVLFPLAEKRAKSALKNKSLDEKTVFPYVKLIYDKVLGEEYQGVINQTFNINQMQAIVNQSMQD